MHVLQATANRLAAGNKYTWTHMGRCNCGHLAQTVTALPPGEIHALALEKRGDWRDHAIEYCPDSGYPIDHIITQLLELGLSTDELAHLERLSDPRVLARLPPERRHLQHKRREDVVLYLRTWAAALHAHLDTTEPLSQASAGPAAANRASPRGDAAHPLTTPPRRRAAA